MDEEAPILRLEILQGPRQGETLDFKPGSAVRIGRIVKGNTLPIKDPGISSKHLSILNESGKWMLRDLDSSNGTVLDTSHIPPNTPFALHHDSTIKIGEFTSIHVIFLPSQQQQHALPPRRNPTRRGRTDPAPAPAPAPVPAASQPVKKRGRKKGWGVKDGDKSQVQSVDENEASVVDVESECVDPPARVTRKSNRGRSVLKELSVDNLILAEKVEEQKDTRNPRLVVVSVSSDDDLDNPVVEEPKQARRTRNSKNTRGVTAKIENVEKKTKMAVAGKRELDKESSVDILILAEKVEEQKSTRNPSLVLVSVSGDDNLDDPVVEEPKKARGTRNSKNTRGVTAKTGNVEKKTKMVVAGERELDEEGEDGNGGKEACDGKEKGNSNEDDRNWPDLNKMTLGEWLDFLEIHFPKQIIDETEEMFDSMTQTAERLLEYIAERQRQNAKDKMALER
ncbi:hypothetical protein LR48_Vigan01g054400 [Vigna angularis]|uniref:FHA domain-containing protein n=2 Tax=Phaseolus angularis TaxID=3914 RepID=A0A0L9TLH9_PHAAN|nr:FHA domain-containing protein At4g14490 [Vigna angularis]XP_052727310.1 FHA domain-containing protein At4g14490 [Vigna angularis]KAG2410212.1 FHA domain-containing protein [Vigna angularis]KOM30989.1 hypothetical protein LR48_Vigan01g054400 [Vigna angularis]BAT73680.1 hypothetical protein VIGAN_01119400 [Vigna angularis var. angularis]